MLLTLRNGTVWSLTDAPEKKYVRALKAKRLGSYNIWPILAAIPLVFTPTVVMTVTYSINNTELHEIIQLLMMLATLPMSIVIMYLMIVLPTRRQNNLHDVRRGLVDDLVPEKAEAFQVLRPVLEVCGGYPENHRLISDYFRQVQKLSGLHGSWWISGSSLGAEDQLKQRRALMTALQQFVQQHPEFRTLLQSNFNALEQQLEADTRESRKRAIREARGQIERHRAKINFHRSAINDLEMMIRIHESELQSLEP